MREKDKCARAMYTKKALGHAVEESIRREFGADVRLLSGRVPDSQIAWFALPGRASRRISHPCHSWNTLELWTQRRLSGESFSRCTRSWPHFHPPWTPSRSRTRTHPPRYIEPDGSIWRCINTDNQPRQYLAYIMLVCVWFMCFYPEGFMFIPLQH